MSPAPLIVMYQKKAYSVSALAKLPECIPKVDALRARLDAGWPVEKAMSEPLSGGGRPKNPCCTQCGQTLPLKNCRSCGNRALLLEGLCVVCHPLDGILPQVSVTAREQTPEQAEKRECTLEWTIE